MKPSETDVVVPYTDLAPAVRAALEADGLRVRYADVSADDRAYWRLLYGIWAAGRTVAIVEHDVVPPPGGVRGLLDCPRDWCSIPYDMGGIEGTALGCVKIGAAVMARTPNAVSRILPEHQGWLSLDSMVLGTLRRNGEPEHVHDGRAEHLHRYGAEPVRDRRNETATRLYYVGDARYLDGVPRTDFETDDPALIALCVGSGLYTRDGVAEQPEAVTAEGIDKAPTGPS